MVWSKVRRCHNDGLVDCGLVVVIKLGKFQLSARWRCIGQIHLKRKQRDMSHNTIEGKFGWMKRSFHD